jgi:hypothetical protein
MVEVFKTNVENADQASALIARIHEAFAGLVVNFDLQDCDRILRVKSAGSIESSALIRLLNQYGFEGEVLPDDKPTLPGSNVILNLKS